MNYDTVKYIIQITNDKQIKIEYFRPSSTRTRMIIKQTRNNILY